MRFKSSILACLLSFVLSFSAMSGLVFSLSKIEKKPKLTNVAELPVQSHHSVQNQQETDILSKESLKEQVESWGGKIEEFESQQSYRESRIATSKKGDGPNVTPEFIPVLQTIEVRTKATKNEESKPIANAIVRLDGVPRFTNRDGRITVQLTKPVYELYIEKSEIDHTDVYNPYLEFMDVPTDRTEDLKTVYLKRKTDDLELTEAVLEYYGPQSGGELTELLNQEFHYLKNQDEYFFDLKPKANVEADVFNLYVKNPGSSQYSWYESCLGNGSFQKIRLGDLEPGSAFAIDFFYNGILSDKVELTNLFIDDNSKIFGEDEMPGEGNGISIDIDEGEDTSIFGQMNMDPNDVTMTLAQQLFPLLRQDRSFDIGPGQLNVNFSFDSRVAEISVAVGYTFNWTAYNSEKAKIEHLNNQIMGAEAQIAKEEANIRAQQEQVREIQSEIDQIKDEKTQIEARIQALKDKPYHDYLDALAGLDPVKAQEKGYRKQKKAILQESNRQFSETQKKLDEAIARRNETRDNTEYADRVGKLAGLVKDLKDDWGDSIFKSQTDAKTVNLALSFEIAATYSLRQHCFKRLQLAVEFDFKFNFGGPFTVGVVPCFWRVELGAGVGIELNAYEKGDNGEPFTFNAFLESIAIKAFISAQGEVGAGIHNLLSVSFFLKLKFEIEYRPALQSCKGELIFTFGLKLKIFIYEDEWAQDIRVPLWDGGAKEKLQDPGVFESEGKHSIMLRSTPAGYVRISQNQLFDGIYQDSRSKLEDLGDRQVLTWIEDCAVRDTYNRTRLMYAVRTDGQWSAPMPVCNDGNSDYFHTTYYDGETLHIAWQKIDRKMSAGDDMQAFAAASEIYYASFDKAGNAFTQPQRMTDNEETDCLPVFAIKERESDSTVLVWQKNSENDVLGQTGVNRLVSKEVGQHAIKEVYATDRYVASFSAALRGGSVALAVVEDADNDLLTADRGVKTVYNGQEKQLSQSLSNSVRFVRRTEDTCLTFFEDGQIMISEDLATANVLLEREYGVSDKYSLSFYGDSALVLYEKLNGDFVQCAYQLIDSNGSSIGGELTQEEGNCSKLNGLYDRQKNRIEFVYNVENALGRCVLSLGSQSFDMAAEIGTCYFPEVLQDGEMGTINVQVRNLGAYPICSLKFDLFGTQILIRPKTQLRHGEDRYFELRFLYDLSADKTLTVTAQYNDAIGCSMQKVLDTSAVDWSITGEVRMENGRQFFHIMTNVTGEQPGQATLLCYVNGIKIKEVCIEAGTIEHVVTLEGVKEGDYIYFVISSGLPDMLRSNNAFGLFSMQDVPKLETEVKENPYKRYIELAKGYAWR